MQKSHPKPAFEASDEFGHRRGREIEILGRGRETAPLDDLDQSSQIADSHC